MNYKAFAARLRDRRKALNLSQRDLAHKIKVTVNSVQSYEAGRLPRGSHLLGLAEALDCSLDWLTGWEGRWPRPSGEESGPELHTFISPPFLSKSGSQGQAPSLSFDRTWLGGIASDPSRIALLAIHGPTMEPTLREGDLALIDQGQRVIHPGRLYAISFDDQLMVNRLEVRPGGVLRIISDNRELTSAYETEIERVVVLGEVVWLSRRMPF